MTTYEGVPTFSTFVSMKLANRLARARSKSVSKPLNTARAWFNSLVKIVLHLAGFGALTMAGFTWNITAGLIVAGLSFFAMAWLMNDQSAEPTAVPVGTYDPMASRR